MKRSKIKLSADHVRRAKELAMRIDREERDAIAAKGRAVHRRVQTLRRIVQDLRAERQRLGLSLSDVGEKSGIGKANLSRLENDSNANPTIDTLQRIAHALGKEIHISIDDPTGPEARQRRSDAA